MQITFAPSARGTIGLEWELALVDPDDGGLVPRADDVLTALQLPDGSAHPRITGELLQNTVELVSAVHPTVGSAIDDLRHQLDEVRAVTSPLGIDLISSGSHPFGQWFEQPISDKQRYHKLIDRTQWWGRNMMIWGVHVHVGVDSVDRVLPLLNGLLTLSPHLQALTASSPFWAGVDTGYASNRALMFQQLPTAGLPQQFRTWNEFELYVSDMTRTGVIEDCTEVRWDLRPAPRWGTLEMRSCDATSTVDEFAAVAALIHCLVEYLNQELDAGRELVTLPRWFVSENKWRAARYGLDAELIVAADGQERLVTDDLELWLERLAPIAVQLECTEQLRLVSRIVRTGGSYQRQRANATASSGDLSAVVSALARELREGLPTR
ncbi:MAG: glutamate--cysteine ligase [Mycetocola sp.]